jgi:hypothetical protein
MTEDKERPIGTWFYIGVGQDMYYHLWQQTESGPLKCGIIYTRPSADFICERLNEPSSRS